MNGRFVSVNWDVEELVGMKDRLKADPGLLRVGLQGVPSTPFIVLFRDDA